MGWQRFILSVEKMSSHLGLGGTLHKFLVDSHQAVHQCVRIGHLFAIPLKCSSFLPVDRLRKSSYIPRPNGILPKYDNPRDFFGRRKNRQPFTLVTGHNAFPSSFIIFGIQRNTASEAGNK